MQVDDLVLAGEQLGRDQLADDALDAGHLLPATGGGALEGEVDAAAVLGELEELARELVRRRRGVAVAAVRSVDDDGLELVDLVHAEVQALAVSGQSVAPCTISSVHGRISH